MKSLLFVTSMVAFGAAVGAVADTAHVPRPMVRAAELSLKDRLARIFPDAPVGLVGEPRGVYLDGYGVVFTAEMNPVNDGLNLMHPTLRPEEKVQIKAKKIARMPDLKKGLKEALVETAASLDAVPLDEQVVLEVVISRFYWEDGSGYPAELIVQAPRRKLLEVKQAKGAGMDAAIRLTER